MLPTPLPTNRRRPGFTIVELLVVIGIIIILMGILLPVVRKVRYAAYTADTQNEISQISNACSQYYSTFHSYPGPFSNDQLEPAGGTIATPVGITNIELYIVSPAGSTSAPAYAKPAAVTPAWPTFPWYITGSENLVLGLMGGLRIDPLNSNPAFAPADVGLGPLTLNPLNPSRAPSFFPTGSTYLMWCEGTAGAGSINQSTQYNASAAHTFFSDPAQTQAKDSPIPEFVDRYPTPGPLPILYIRARTGAKGVVSDGTITDAVLTAQIAAYQYDLREITPYTNTHIGLVATDNSGNAITHNLVAMGTISSPPVAVTKAGVDSNGTTPTPPALPTVDAFPYLVNASIPPTNISDPNYYGRPRAVDTFILISAGPDGIYGTTDDITSFGDVSQ